MSPLEHFVIAEAMLKLMIESAVYQRMEDVITNMHEMFCGDKWAFCSLHQSFEVFLSNMESCLRNNDVTADIQLIVKTSAKLLKLLI